MTTCSNFTKNIFYSRTNIYCDYFTQILIFSCIFENIYNPNLNGGAIYCDSNKISLNIDVSFFKSIISQNGGAIYSIIKDQNISNTCFYNISAQSFQAIYTTGNSLSIYINKINSFFNCPNNFQGSWYVNYYYYGQLNLNNQNYSNNILFYHTAIDIYYITLFCNYSILANNRMGCLYRTHYSTCFVNYTSHKNNTNISTDWGLVHSWTTYSFYFENSIFINNKYNSIQYDNVVIIKNCILFDNSFISNNISLNPTIYQILNPKNCLVFLLNSKKSLKNRFFKIYFIINFFFNL